MGEDGLRTPASNKKEDASLFCPSSAVGLVVFCGGLSCLLHRNALVGPALVFREM